MQDLITLGGLLVTLASIITATTHTPEPPDADAPWLRKLWYQIYPLVELLALVGDRTKQRPDVAAKLAETAAAARAGADARSVAEAVEGVAALLGRR